MTPNPSERTRIGAWLHRTRLRLALLRDRDYRRSGYRAFLLELRGLAGLRFAALLLLVSLTGAWIVQAQVDSPADGFDALMQLFAVATVLAAAPIYAAEQRQGTFELLWLARGSRRGLLQAKAGVLLAGLAAMMMPAVLLVSWYLYGTMPPLRVMVFLTINSLLIVSVMAWAGTMATQTWAGGLLGAAVIAALYFGLGERVSVFNVFLNPLATPEAVSAGGGAFRAKVDPASIAVANRIFALLCSVGFLNTAASRLHRALRG